MCSASSFAARHARTIPWALVGGVLSVYALYVEHKTRVHAERPDDDSPDSTFSAWCDIEQIGASCSNVFQLPEGRMLTYFGLVPEGSVLDVPNATLGWLYYTVWLIMVPKLNELSPKLVFVAASMAMASSVWLAIQLLLLHELCLLCWSTHVINARLWWCAYCNLTKSGSSSGAKKAVAAAPKEKKIKKV